MKKIKMAVYRGAVDGSLGWCLDCKDFTREMTEPDADYYRCPDCGERCVVGAELALIMGAIEVS